jgi:hypothetical protein
MMSPEIQTSLPEPASVMDEPENFGSYATKSPTSPHGTYTSFYLVPSNTGEPGGKSTGDRVSHFIREGGLFDKACATFLTDHAALLYQDLAYSTAEDEPTVRNRLRKAASKTRYVCPACGLRAWARPGAQIRHVDCDEEMDWRAE